MASVRKRTWTGNDGKPCEAWCVEYTDAAGKRRRWTPKSGLKKDAETGRKRIERELTDGTFVPQSQTMTVLALCDAFREHVVTKLRDGRISESRLIQQDIHFRFIRNAMGTTLLTDLTPVQLEALYNDLVGQEGLVPSTAKNVLYTVKMMQDFAITRGWLVKRPADEALRGLRGIRQTPIETFSQTTALTLLKAAALRPRGHRAYHAAMLNCFVNLAAFCGLRYGEIIGLTVENVDFDERMIRVRHSFCRYTVKLKGPKTAAGLRDVPMPPHVAVLLREWLDAHHLANPLNLFFTSLEAKWMQQSNFRNNMWLPLLKRSGLLTDDPLHFHSLRHFAASWMIECGMPLTEVARILGHSKFDMTLQVYAHPVNPARHARAAVDQMAQRLLMTSPTIELDPAERDNGPVIEMLAAE